MSSSSRPRKIPRPKASASAVPGLRPTHARQSKLRATPRSSALIDRENLSRASSSSGDRARDAGIAVAVVFSGHGPSPGHGRWRRWCCASEQLRRGARAAVRRPGPRRRPRRGRARRRRAEFPARRRRRSRRRAPAIASAYPMATRAARTATTVARRPIARTSAAISRRATLTCWPTRWPRLSAVSRARPVTPSADVGVIASRLRWRPVPRILRTRAFRR